MQQTILLASPRGFCAGVDRAISIVERALELFGAPIYVRHEVVHNRFVVDGLRKKGAIFVAELDEVPDGATVIFSAHGVSRAVQDEARRRGLRVFDATCPLVTKVHIEVRKHAQEGREVILIGHSGHPEVEGTIGQYVGEGASRGAIYLVETLEDVERLEVKNPDDLAYSSQTTLSMDDTAKIIEALRKRFPKLRGPRKDDICYATQNRQDAVKELVRKVNVLLVVGSRNSSNSNRLRELAERGGVPAYLIDGADDIRREWVQEAKAIGVTAGASAPEVLVQEVVARLQGWGAVLGEPMRGREEHITFSLPRELVRLARGQQVAG
ncbi:MAG: 4-hydroxy-3-methylbut-2-enyl diphosphate reductase [Xanthomonadaceae bacterium]|nr:4-hydroxy-3-methylbut-2-enyl diphosphate reductase [Xanthomonadaceae bacterium]